MRSMTRWSAELVSDVGDTSIDVFVHPLKERPDAIVDYEERLEALQADPAHVLLGEGRTPSYGIIVTCSGEAGPIFETLREMAAASGPQVSLAYHPQLDRILGGDAFRQLKDVWAKSTLLSTDRAMRIRDLVGELREQVPGESPPGAISPLPIPLAIIQLNVVPAADGDQVVQLDIDQLFELPSLRRAPAEYRQLVQMISVIASPHRIAGQAPSSADALMSFARRLFGWLGIAHSLRYAFSRGGSSCLVPAFIAVDGSATDVYYITRDDRDFDALRRLDVGNAMVTTAAASRDVIGQSPEVFAASARAYAGSRPVPRRLEAVARALDARLAEGAKLQREPSFHVFVDSLAAQPL